MLSTFLWRHAIAFFCVSSAASGPVPLDNTPIVTVVNIAGAKIDKAIALLSAAEIEEGAHT
jgi:hypothetical protein